MTIYEHCINETIEEMVGILSKRGSYSPNQKAKVEELLNETKTLLMRHRDSTFEELLIQQNQRLQETIERLMEEKKTSGLAFGYQLMDGPQFEFYRGRLCLEKQSPYVDATTKFQAASITKELVAFFLCTLEQQGLLDFSKKVNELGKGFDHLDASLLQLMNGNVIVQTGYHDSLGNFIPKRIDECSTYQEGLELLKQAIITTRDTYLYQDNPWMILRELVDQYPSKMAAFLRQCGMNNTGYEIRTQDFVTGGKYPEIRLDQDKKAQIMDHPGHCGLYVTLPDLLQLSSKLYRYRLVSQKNVQLLITPAIPGETFVDGKGVERTNHRAILNRKHPSGLTSGEVYELASDTAMAKDGFTGTYHVTDIPNGYGLAILTNPLSSHEDGKKPPRYPWTLDTLKIEGTNTALQTKLIQKVYEDCYGLESKDQFQKTYRL